VAASDYVFDLRFDDKRALERAFARISDEVAVVSCLVEPDLLRIRLLADEAVGDALVDELYAQRGLVWCKRHPLERPAAGG